MAACDYRSTRNDGGFFVAPAGRRGVSHLARDRDTAAPARLLRRGASFHCSRRADAALSCPILGHLLQLPDCVSHPVRAAPPQVARWFHFQEDGESADSIYGWGCSSRRDWPRDVASNGLASSLGP